LEALCLDPSAFYDHEIHTEVSRFSGRIIGLIDLLNNPPSDAHSYWSHKLEHQYDLCLKLIQAQLKSLDKP
jgi:hypothetical protein